MAEISRADQDPCVGPSPRGRGGGVSGADRLLRLAGRLALAGSIAVGSVPIAAWLGGLPAATATAAGGSSAPAALAPLPAASPTEGGVVEKGPVVLGSDVEDELRDEGEEHWYTFQGRQDQVVGIVVNSPDDSDLDPYLELVDPSGNTVAEDDDGASNLPGASAADPLVVARLPSTGTYTIVVSAAGGVGPYTLITMAAE